MMALLASELPEASHEYSSQKVPLSVEKHLRQSMTCTIAFAIQCFIIYRRNRPSGSSMLTSRHHITVYRYTFVLPFAPAAAGHRI